MSAQNQINPTLILALTAAIALPLSLIGLVTSGIFCCLTQAANIVAIIAGMSVSLRAIGSRGDPQ